MASRDIANMHFFLDLKKKFPDLPDDTLRNYIFLYAEDQEKCINLLQKEMQNHYHPSQPFADFRMSDNKVNSRIGESFRIASGVHNENFTPFPATSAITAPSIQVPSGKSTSFPGVIQVPAKSWNPNMSSKPDSYSAPVVSDEKPFTDMYRHIPISSHVNKYHVSNKDHKMMFSTTKEHIVSPPAEKTTYLSISPKSEQSKRHAVKLNITPSFPYPPQAVNLFNNSVCATASHSARPGHHTTSINFQLQPQSSSQYPLEISTIPTNLGGASNYRDFESRVQISLGHQGGTFTALRVQHPGFPPNQNNPYSVPAEDYSKDFVASSPIQNSNRQMFSSQQFKHVPDLGTSENYDFQKHAMSFYPPMRPLSMIDFQSSPEYVLDVKNRQIAKLDMILNQLEKEKRLCSQLKAEVNQMEEELAKRKASKNAAAFLQIEKINKLREENRQLRIECNCLLMEVDMCNVGQVPLGVTDENFYSNIYTGPNGAINSSKKEPANFPKQKSSPIQKKKSFDDDDDESKWKCKNCTFANHPALEKCEICELPKSSGSFFDN